MSNKLAENFKTSFKNFFCIKKLIIGFQSGGSNKASKGSYRGEWRTSGKHSVFFFFFFNWKNPLIYVSAVFKLEEKWGGGDNNLSWPFPNDKWLDAVIHSFFPFLFLFFSRRLSITIPRATITVIMIPKILNRTFLVVLSVIEVTVVFAGKKNRLRAVFIGAAAQAFCWLFTRFTESS